MTTALTSIKELKEVTNKRITLMFAFVDDDDAQICVDSDYYSGPTEMVGMLGANDDPGILKLIDEYKLDFGANRLEIYKGSVHTIDIIPDKITDGEIVYVFDDIVSGNVFEKFHTISEALNFITTFVNKYQQYNVDDLVIFVGYKTNRPKKYLQAGVDYGY